MTKRCAHCNASIDTNHDDHYRCTTHNYYICEECYKTHTNCPHCGKSVKHHSPSYQKRAFKDPGARGLLGF
jgi:hypothetical protein